MDLIDSLFNVNRWRGGATPESLRRWDKWDREMRRHYGFWRTLRWFTKNSSGGLTIVSMHWPHRLCWSWFLSWYPWRKGFDGPRMIRLRISMKYRSAIAHVWFGRIGLYWQDYGHMASVNRPDAPRIEWTHHHKLTKETEAVGNA